MMRYDDDDVDDDDDVFREKVLTTPEKPYNRKYGVILTKITEDGTAVGVTIEGGFLARSYLLGLINSTCWTCWFYLDLLACQSKKKLKYIKYINSLNIKITENIKILHS